MAGSPVPGGGKCRVGWLTNEIERGARAYLEKIEAMGGALRAIEQGFMQREIQEAAYRTLRAIEKGEQVVVSVNRFVTDEKPVADILRVDPSVQANQCQRLAELRAGRDNDKVDALLAQLEAAARDPQAPLMPLFVACLENYVTLGEICGTLRHVFGEYRPESWV